MIVEMTLDHALYVCLNMRESDKQAIFCQRWSDNLDDFVLERYQTEGVSATVLKDGVPVCIGGLAYTTPGVATLWVVGTDKLKTAILEMTRFLRVMIDGAFKSDIHRIQATVISSNRNACEYLAKRGFVKESKMKAAGKHGEDFTVYSMWRKK